MSKRIKAIKYLVLSITEIEMLFFSGIAFGMNSLFPTLSSMQYFCAPANSTNPCGQQRQYLGYLLITTIISYSVVAVPIGMFYDRFGNFKTKIASATFVFLGCLSFALSSIVNQYLAFVASILLGFLAQTMLTCNIALSSLFPSFQNKIVSIYSGSFDSSNIVMTFITLGYRGGIPILTSFLTLAFAGLFICSTTSILCHIIERKKYACTDPLQDQPHNEMTLEEDKGSYEYLEKRVNERFPTLVSVLRSRQYIMQTANLTIMFFRYAFFLAELNLQLEHLFPNDVILISNLLLRSSYILVAGVVFSPLPGLILDYVWKRTKHILRTCEDKHLYGNSLICFTPSLFFCTTMNVILSVVILIPHQAAIYASYVAFMFMRVTLFSTNSSYLLQAFPKRFFGKIFGISVLISGALSFIQYALLFDDDRKLTTVNYAMIVLVALAYIHPILLLTKK